MNFYEFIAERLRIYQKKEVLKEPFPWTNDSVLQKHKFCNAQRHLDRGTQTLLRLVIHNTALNPVEKLQNIVFYRMFNSERHFSIFPIILDWKKQKGDVLEMAGRYAEMGVKMFNNAYAIRAGKPKWKNIIEACANVDYEKLHRVLRTNNWMIALNEIKQQVKHAGDFIAGQILLDCGYNDTLTAITGDDFIVVGPGALDGLKIIYGEDLGGEDPVELVRKLHDMQPKFDFIQRYPEPSMYSQDGKLSYMDIQHCLCEYRKWVNWSKGKGLMRLYHQH